MTFTIDQIYKVGVPRGELFVSDVLSLTSSLSSPLTVSPATNPNWVILVEKVRIWQSSASATGSTDVGLLQIDYPNYVGESENNWIFDDYEMIENYADDEKVIGSNTYHDIVFKPPAILRAGNTVSNMTLRLPDNREISGGSLSCYASGWKIKESDYE